MLPVTKVELGGGDYVQLYTHLLVKTQRAVQALCTKYATNGTVTPDALKGHEDEVVECFFTNQAVALHLRVVKRHWWGIRGKRVTFTPPFNYAKLMDVLELEKLNIIEREMNRLYSDPKMDASGQG